MTVKELAGRLEVGLSTAYGLIAAGKIRHRRIGAHGRGAIRVDEESLQEFLARVERAAERGDTPTPPPAARPGGFTELDGRRLLDAWRRRGARASRPGGRSAR